MSFILKSFSDARHVAFSRPSRNSCWANCGTHDVSGGAHTICPRSARASQAVALCAGARSSLQVRARALRSRARRQAGVDRPRSWPLTPAFIVELAVLLPPPVPGAALRACFVWRKRSVVVGRFNIVRQLSRRRPGTTRFYPAPSTATIAAGFANFIPRPASRVLVLAARARLTLAGAAFILLRSRLLRF